MILKLLPYFFWWAVYICTWTLIIWRCEIGNPDFNDQLGKGFSESRFFVHVVISSTGLGNQIPRSKLGLIVTVVLMYSGIGFMFPIITGKISSEYEVARVQDKTIMCKEDLKGKVVAVKKGTTAVEAAKKMGAQIKYVSHLDEAVNLVKGNKVLAVISDFVALKYAENQDETLLVFKDIFEHQNYGIVLPYDSPLREAINRKILKLKETKELDRLKQKWIENNPF